MLNLEATVLPSASAVPTLAIIGGGAAGMCAAIAAHDEATKLGRPIQVILFERNDRLGIKIRISGGGKCNITHDGPIESLLKEGFLEKPEQRFLRHSMFEYTNTDVLQMLTDHGVAWHSRDNGRIFPDSGRAQDVLSAFERELARRNIEVRTGSRITRLLTKGNAFIIILEGESIESAAVILATGGVSYQKVGTTGDGIRFAKSLGHSVAPILSALAPIYTHPPPPAILQGTPIRTGELLIMESGQVRHREREDILITHRGVSGPAALNSSRNAAKLLAAGSNLQLGINLLALTDDACRQMLLSLQTERSQQQISRWLSEVIPDKLAPLVLEQARIEAQTRWNQLRKEQRSALAEALTRFYCGEIAEVPLDKGEVTAGGVSLPEVNPKTMESRIVPRLFLAGEMLDIAGEIGGYNLQAAYSTGFLAGGEAAKAILS